MCDSAKASRVMDYHLVDQTFVLKTAYTGKSSVPAAVGIDVLLKFKQLYFIDLIKAFFYKLQVDLGFNKSVGLFWVIGINVLQKEISLLSP